MRLQRVDEPHQLILWVVCGVVRPAVEGRSASCNHLAADETSSLFCDHNWMTARIRFAAGVLVLLLVGACNSTTRPAPAVVAMPAAFDACTLLTSTDLKDVQGEEPVVRKASDDRYGSVVIQ